LGSKHISPAGKFSRPLPSIHKGRTADKNSKKKTSNSKKGDNAKGLHSNEHPPPVGGNDDNKLPVKVIRDNSAVDGVTINLATGRKNSTKKRKSHRTKRDIANGVGGIDVGGTDGGNGGVDATVDLFGISNNINVVRRNDNMTPDGVIGDNAMGEGVLNNLATGTTVRRRKKIRGRRRTKPGGLMVTNNMLRMGETVE
jgi:hypothetical protein